MPLKFIKKLLKSKTKKKKKEHHDHIGKEIRCLKCNEITPGYCCGICFRWYCKNHVEDHHCIYSRNTPGEKCSFCKKKYGKMGGFYCMYCTEYFCEKHHPPKKHKCKHPLHR
jgi:hypothetical protein